MFAKMFASVALSLLVSLSTPAHAAVELLTNGGFEAGSFAGWTQSPNPLTDTSVTGVGEYVPQSGNFYALLSYGIDGPPPQPNTLGSLSQTFADVIGQQLTLSFYVTADGRNPSNFSVLFNNVVLQNLTSGNAVPAQGWTQYSFAVTGTGNDTLRFDFNDIGQFPGSDHIPSNLGLDNVSVLAADVVTGVPEPSTWLLMLFGFAAIASIARKRRLLKTC
jgi:hypothetical protein